MSPEQFAGGEVDARTDQFSFCVALYEAIHGRRPFLGDDVSQLAIEVTSGHVREPPRDRAAPAWLDAVIRRGLRVDPSERFPSMEALVRALDGQTASGPRPVVVRRARLRGMGAAVGVAIALASGGLVWRANRARPLAVVSGPAREAIVAPTPAPPPPQILQPAAIASDESPSAGPTKATSAKKRKSAKRLPAGKSIARGHHEAPPKRPATAPRAVDETALKPLEE
jgi:hypothetical protein